MSGRITYVNAGHNPPIVMRADGTASYLRTRPGLVLGAMPGIKYRSQEIDFAPGDTIYLYTDGITEQPDDQGELFGEERLLAAISKTGAGSDLAKLLQSVLAHVSAYAAGADQADDCTQLVIRYSGSNA